METAMKLQKEIGALSRMTVGQLPQKYREVFGEDSRSNHKQFLFRRIAGASKRWRRADSPIEPDVARSKSPTMRIYAFALRRP